jgi:hypothetical protein
LIESDLVVRVIAVAAQHQNTGLITGFDDINLGVCSVRAKAERQGANNELG